MRILLISATRRPYFEHCRDEINEFLGPARKVAFVTAASLYDENEYFRVVSERFVQSSSDSMAREFIHLKWNHNGLDVLREAEAIFVGGGNTYAVLQRLKQSSLIEAIRERVWSGLPYIGSSAGSNIVGPNILTTNDWNVVGLTEFSSLGLVSFNINPHYPEGSRSETPHSETRDDRIREYHQLWGNDVIAMEEKVLVRIEETSVKVVGEGRVKVFSMGRGPRSFIAGENMDFRSGSPVRSDEEQCTERYYTTSHKDVYR